MNDNRINKWLEYERRKAEWIAKHPNSTPEQYERMIMRLCKELGV